MNLKEARAIYSMIHRTLSVDQTGDTHENIEADYLKAVVAGSGNPGTGVCICQHNPNSFKRMWGDTPEKLREAKGCMILDHRCPEHGEKAQPALWGRHKEKELSVSWNVWESLGVEYK